MNSSLKLAYCLLLIFAAGQAFSQAPDIILVNGKIFTSDEKNPYVSALAVTGNRITATGDSRSISSLATTKTKVIDLQGKTVVPGFNDAHYHSSPYRSGKTISFNPGQPQTWQQLKDSIRQAVSSTPKGTFIHVEMGEDVGTDTSINRKMLDALAPGHPLMMNAYWGHVTYFNTQALKRLGVSETQPDIKGGFFGREKGTNILNGRAYEEACNFLKLKIPTNENLFQASLSDLGKEALYYGVTSIQNMGTAASPDVFISMLKKEPLPIRFRLIRWAGMNNNGQPQIPAKNISKVEGLPLVSVSGTKWMLDGTPIERLAMFTRPYQDQPGWNGVLDFTEPEVRVLLKELEDRKDQPMFHVVGDSTINFMLKELGKSPATWSERRVRFEHGDGLMPESFELAKRLNVIVVQNPSHFMVAPVLNQRYDEGLRQHAEPVKSLLKAGIPVAFGSDGPLNPYLNIMFACMHPFRPSEALSVEEAVIAYTKTSAFAEFEDEKGMLVPGQLADLVVLSADIFTIPLNQLPATHSLLTMVDGKIMYEKK